jgi:hypothetical protein
MLFHAFITVGNEVIIKGTIISHADFPLKGQKRKNLKKFILELQVFFCLIYKSIAPSFYGCYSIL